MESIPGVEPEVIKPSSAAWKSGPLLLGGMFLAAVVATYFSWDDIVATAGLAAVSVVIVAGMSLAVLRSRLEIRPGEVVRRGTFGSTRVTAASLDRVVWIAAFQELPGKPFKSRVVGISRSGASPFRLTEGIIWSREAVFAVARALAAGARVVNVDQPVDKARVMVFEPEALSWGERHPGMLVLMSLVGTFAFVAVLFGIFVLTS